MYLAGSSKGPGIASRGEVLRGYDSSQGQVGLPIDRGSSFRGSSCSSLGCWADFIGRRRSGPHYEQFMRPTGAFWDADTFIVPKAIPNTAHINRLAFAILAGLLAFDDPSAWGPLWAADRDACDARPAPPFPLATPATRRRRRTIGSMRMSPFARVTNGQIDCQRQPRRRQAR